MIKPNLFAVWKSKEARLGRRLTLREVSEATGISIPTLSRWTNNHPIKRFRSETVAALCRFFDCTLAELLIEEEEV